MVSLRLYFTYTVIVSDTDKAKHSTDKKATFFSFSYKVMLVRIFGCSNLTYQQPIQTDTGILS